MTGYRMATLNDGKRVRVVMNGRRRGFVVRFSESCSGCTEIPEYTTGPERGIGCEECGYTGRSRREEWIPLSHFTAQRRAT